MKKFTKNYIIALTLLLLSLQACSRKFQLSGIDKKQYAIDQKLPQDSAMLAYYYPYKMQLDSIMIDIVAVSLIEIKKEQPEGPLNNFFADAMYQSGKDKGIAFDFAYTNYGGLRITLPKGDIPRYKIFELMPFENV